jgi:hypothetical protein
MKITDKALLLTSLFALVPAFIIVITVSFWLSYPYRTVEVSNSPMPVEFVHTEGFGNHILFHAEFCSYTDKEITIHRRLVNTQVISFPEIKATIPKGCDIRDLYLKLPKVISPGVYYLDWHIEVQVNPLRKEEYSFTTQEFVIEESIIEKLIID